MIWLLDTNVLIQAHRNDPPVIRMRLRERSPDEVVVSSVTVAELWYGAGRSADPERTRTVWMRALAPYEILPFDRAAAEYHGNVRFALRHDLIGERDLLIAAIALAKDLTVVSGNVREFRRVSGLRVEDWTATA